MPPALFAALLLLLAQGRPPDAGQGRTTFRASTRLVEVSVLVQDRDGRPVGGLTATDFHVFDGGVEQPIELFSVHAGAVEAAAPSAGTAPGVFTNQVERGGSATVLLFDKLNTYAPDQVFARKNLIAFLKDIRPDDRVAIYVFEGPLRVLHDFSNDTASLVRSVARLDAATSADLAGSEGISSDAPSTGDAALDAQFAAALENTNREMITHYSERRSDATAAAFTAIANRLATVNGRKSLVWITSGVPLVSGRRSATSVVQEMTRPLNDANVAVYPVDARGLVGALAVGPKGQVSFTTLASVFGPIQNMQTIAAETGGRAFYNTNDIRGSVRRAIDDGGVTYTLGYYPSHGQWNGRYRKISVKVDRKGAEVRHRNGYFADDASARGPTASHAALRAAVESPLEATGISLTARVEPASAGSVTFAVTVAASTITLRQSGGEWHGAIDLVVAQALPDGTTQRDISQSIELRMTPERYREIRTGGITLDGTVSLHPNVQRLHVVVQDAPSGRTGSIVIPRGKLPR